MSIVAERVSYLERIYSHIPDTPDERDYIYKTATTTFPTSVDLRPQMSPIVDQGQLGSCTANAIASGLREYMEIINGQSLTRLSRLYLYYKEREIEGTLSEDSGAYIRDGMKVLQQFGCAPETEFPYDITKFKDAPTAIAEQDAATFKVAEYHRITSYDDMKAALANGQPVVIGITVYESFETYDVSNGGLLPTPDTTKEKMLGGHALLAIGYNPKEHPGDYIVIRNSWGKDWGDNGNCYMPKSYWDNGLVNDMWTASLTKPLVKPEDLTFHQAIAQIVKEGVFVDPVFWDNFEAKYKAGTLVNADFLNVFYGFRKIAADDINLGR